MKLKLNTEQRDRLGIVDGPLFKDGCEHGQDSYVCSYEILDPTRTPPFKRYDLYLFPQKFYGTEVCIRYGDEAPEYISPGGLGEFLNTAGTNWKQLHEYTAASRILREFGVFSWEPREVRHEIPVS